MNNLHVASMNRREIEQMADQCDTYILPIGSTEQHGYHLPYSTDTLLANYLAGKVAEKIQAFCLPEINYGYSWVWRNIIGSVSLSQQTVQRILEDIGHSLSRLKAKKFVIINGHDANNATLKYATRELSDKIQTKVYYIFYPNIKEAYAKYCESETWNGIFHADELETSLMLYAYPELVNMKQAVAEYPIKPEKYGYSDISLGEISKSGVYGNPVKASKETGEKLFRFFIDKIVEIVS